MKKRAVGIVLLLGFAAVAVAHYALSEPQATTAVEPRRSPSGPGSEHAKPTKALLVRGGVGRASSSQKGANGPAYEGGCSAFDPPLENPPTDDVDDNRGEAKRVLDTFFGYRDTTFAPSPALPAGVQFAIAFAPDPKHTHLQLFFDREVMAIQQAAQSAQYDYDASWFPWRDSFPEGLGRLADRQRTVTLERQREACPGVLLFRRRVNGQDKADSSNTAPFDQSLVVFVVGEQPTGGINAAEWNNAITWLKFVGRPVRDATEPLRILGPNFSGSFASLIRAVEDVSTDFHKILILSGSATSRTAIDDFQSRLRSLEQTKNASGGDYSLAFGAFNENDDLHIARFLKYLAREHTQQGDVAIVSEDETAYGNYTLPPPPPSGQNSEGDKIEKDTKDEKDKKCEKDNKNEKDKTDEKNKTKCSYPLELQYPRDISAVRSAYEKQEVFDSALSKDRTVHAILRDHSDADLDESLDSLPQYAGESGAVDEEARLFGLVDAIRSHHSRYIILRASNPLDFLFLSRFFHRADPDARIVTVGADMLFRREIETTEFRGSLALSSFPLIARDTHWLAMPPSDSRHFVFPGNQAEGTYLAARYLLDRDIVAGWKKQNPGENDSTATDYCTESDRKTLQTKNLIFRQLADPAAYDVPFWLHPQDTAPNFAHAETWLNTLGRDGYWNIAVLDNPPGAGNPAESKLPDCSHLSTLVQLKRVGETELSGPKSADRPNVRPLSWKICLSLAIFLAIYQGVGLNGGVDLRDLWALVLGMYAAPFHVAWDSMNIRQRTKVRRWVTRPRWVLRKLKRTLRTYLDSQSWYLDFRGLLIALALTRLGTVSDGLFFVFHNHPHTKAQSRLRGMSSALALTPLVLLTAPQFDLYLKGFNPFLWQDRYLYLIPILFTLFFTYQVSPARHLRRPAKPFEDDLEQRRKSKALAIHWFAYCLILLLFGVWEYLRHIPTEFLAPTIYRMMHISSGVSSLAPVLVVTLSLYLWNWQMMAANLMTATGRPVLPTPAELGKDQYRLSSAMGDQIVDAARFSWIMPQTIWTLLALAIGLAYCFRENTRAVTLEGRYFNVSVRIWLLASIVLIAFMARILFSTWVELRRLLLALDRSRLRIALARLEPLSARSLWTVSANVHRVQYRIFFQQYSALQRLVGTYGIRGANDCLGYAESCGKVIVERSRSEMTRGVAVFWRSQFECDGRNVRQIFSAATAYLMNTLLRKSWNKKTSSLFAMADEKPDMEAATERWEREKIETAEEFVCAHYVAFIQNILASMRTTTISIAILLIGTSFAIATYPLTSRPMLTSLLAVAVILVGAIVAYVYAGMDRDKILSMIAQTDPGRLGPEFWFKLGGFLIGPVIGVLATQYPSLVESVLGWIQPGVSSIK